MKPKTITIAGAGPAGLAAAIVLARRGHAVRVFERSRRAGSRFNDDLQGLENWTTAGNCLDELRGFGIEPTWWQRPFCGADLYNAALRRTQVQSRRPLFYMVRRGAACAGSLDNALVQQAQAAGAEVCFGQRADPAAVQVFAGGPSGRPTAVVRGLTFRTNRPDLACTILSQHLAPQGYVYFLVAGGQATLAVVLLHNFAQSTARLAQAVATVQQLYGVQLPADARRWGGYAGFSIPASAVQQGVLQVGEAAGFQDALFGFGIRTAMVSGALAAVALDEASDYDRAWRTRLGPQLQASRINRAVFQRFGFAGQALWHLMRAAPRGDQVLRLLYGGSALHRVAWPWAWLHGRTPPAEALPASA